MCDVGWGRDATQNNKFIKNQERCVKSCCKFLSNRNEFNFFRLASRFHSKWRCVLTITSWRHKNARKMHITCTFFLRSLSKKVIFAGEDASNVLVIDMLNANADLDVSLFRGDSHKGHAIWGEGKIRMQDSDAQKNNVKIH